MYLKVFNLTEGYTKTYSWFVNEPAKTNKNGRTKENLDLVLWGVTKIEVSDYGLDIGSLLIFILKR
jgi:hypothetical protein